MIVTSTFTEGPTQQDGRRYVTEVHTTSEGDELKHQWLGDQDAQMVMDARAAVLNAQYAAKTAAQALVVGSLTPLSKLEFRNLFGAKKVAVDAFNAAFESHPVLTAEQKAVIRSGLEDFKESKYIERPFRADVSMLLGLYQAVGLLTPAEVSAIVGAGNG